MANTIDCLSVKITLLSLVNNLPEQPSINTSSQHIELGEPQPSRTQIFKHEIPITQQLAFICAYSDDPLHFLAICIVRSILRHCLIIRFAANTAKHESLIDGLKTKSQILQNEAVNGSAPRQNSTLYY